MIANLSYFFRYLIIMMIAYHFGLITYKYCTQCIHVFRLTIHANDINKTKNKFVNFP